MIMSEKTKRRTTRIKVFAPPPPFHLMVGGAAGKTAITEYYSTKLMRERLELLMAQRHINAKALSAAAGLAATFVSDILAERSTSPGLFPVMKIAAALKTHLAFLIGESHNEHSNGQGQQQITQCVPMVATIETGAYRALPTDPKYPLVAVPRCPQYPDANAFTVQINDLAMNACPVGAMVPGMQAVCVDMASAGLTIESGRLYCLRCTQDQGRTWEWLIRRARVFSDRTVFETESSLPGFEPIVVRGAVTIDSGVAPSRRIRSGVVVIGLVYKVTIDVLL
jgi:hypothetical protein